MPALETVGQYIEESRRLLQDEFTPYRYPDDDLVDALNIGLQEARRLRADLFLPLFDMPWVDPTTINLTTPISLDPMYRSTWSITWLGVCSSATMSQQPISGPLPWCRNSPCSC